MEFLSFFKDYMEFIPSIFRAFSSFFTLGFSDVYSLLNSVDNPIFDIFLSLVDISGLSTFFSSVTLFEFALGGGLVLVLLVNFIKWLIP